MKRNFLAVALLVGMSAPASADVTIPQWLEAYRQPNNTQDWALAMGYVQGLWWGAALFCPQAADELGESIEIAAASLAHRAQMLIETMPVTADLPLGTIMIGEYSKAGCDMPGLGEEQ